MRILSFAEFWFRHHKNGKVMSKIRYKCPFLERCFCQLLWANLVNCFLWGSGDYYLSIGYEVMRNLSFHTYFWFQFLGRLLVEKWAWPPLAPLMVWVLQTWPKILPAGQLLSWNHVFKVFWYELPPPYNQKITSAIFIPPWYSQVR